jgi:hypothetical protein
VKKKSKRKDWRYMAPVAVPRGLADTVTASATEQQRSVQSWCRLAMMEKLIREGYAIPKSWSL